MSKFRVKIDMSDVAVNPSRVWYLIDPEICNSIEQLKLQIFDRFNVLYTAHRFAVFVQDFIIPDDESIEVLKPDDTLCLRLKPSKLKRLLADCELKKINKPEEVLVLSNESRRNKKKFKRLQLNGSTPINLPDKSESETELHNEAKKRKLPKHTKQTEDSDTKASSNDSHEKLLDNKQLDEVDYDAMFPLPKKRRRHRNRNSSHQNDEVFPVKDNKNCEEEKSTNRIMPKNPFVRLESIGNRLTVRKHLRFTDDDDEPSKINGSDTCLTKGPADIVENEVEVIKETPQSNDEVQETLDLSKFEQLIGPPRPNDRISYQVLELSTSYTPELSCLRIGKVKSYDPISNIVKVDLEKPISTKPRKGKFELIENVIDDDYEDEELEEEEEILIENESYHLSDMINVKVSI